MQEVAVPEEGSSSRVLHLVFTDLVESTALKTARGDQRAGEILARERALLVRVADECAGRIVDFAGDGCFLTFETASAAVLFALTLQERHAREPDLPRVRIGIHVGEVTEHAARPSGDPHPHVEGLAVDLASRIQSLAQAGQVLVSSAVAASARPRLANEAAGRAIRWQSHGQYELKGASDPLELFEVGLVGIAPFAAPREGEKGRPLVVPRRSARLVVLGALGLVAVAVAAGYLTRSTSRGLPPIRAIAVLPLENLSPDPEQDYFADGMTEMLIGELAKVGALRVISRTSVMQYKGAHRPLREIAGELGVDAIVEGTVLREGEQVRIAAQLIDARDDHNLWAQSYDRDLRAVLQIQSEVARAVAARVAIALSPRETALLAPPAPVDPRAQDSYLRGLQQWSRFSPESIRRSIAFFEDALRIEPKYALAHAAVGHSYFFLCQPLHAMPHLEAMPKAKAAALRALELDDRLGEAHGVLAAVHFFFDWDWQAAEQEFRSAIELSPQNPQGRIAYAFYLVAMGRRDEGLQQADLAVVVSPIDPTARVGRADLLNLAGLPERALLEIDRIREIAPGLKRAFLAEGRADAQLGRYDAAVRAARSELGPDRADASAELERSWKQDGVQGYWRFWQSEYARRGEFFQAAAAYAATGEKDRAFEALEKAYQSKDGSLVLLQASPGLKPLRHDPRFGDLTRRLGLPNGA